MRHVNHRGRGATTKSAIRIRGWLNITSIIIVTKSNGTLWLDPHQVGMMTNSCVWKGLD